MIRGYWLSPVVCMEQSDGSIRTEGTAGACWGGTSKASVETTKSCFPTPLGKLRFCSLKTVPWPRGFKDQSEEHRVLLRLGYRLVAAIADRERDRENERERRKIDPLREREREKESERAREGRREGRRERGSKAWREGGRERER